MNDHPEQLLAGYVERSLEADERALVEGHVETCRRCRDEVELAEAARASLAALPELEPPAGIPLAVRRKARAAPSRAWRLVGAAAVAAAVIAGGVVAISNLDFGARESAGPSSGAEEQQPRAADAPAEAAGEGQAAEESAALTDEPAPAVPLILPLYAETRRDYEPAGLSPLARRLRDEARVAIAAGVEPTATGFFEDFDPAAFTPEVRQAIRCVLTDLPPDQLIVPYLIEAASFQGEPAYVAAFLQGPAPDQPYDRVVIWVVSRQGCRLLSLASQQL